VLVCLDSGSARQGGKSGVGAFSLTSLMRCHRDPFRG
jgi:hypothetical protein